MLDCDRVSRGWQVWLTPRQTRIIRDALFCVAVLKDDEQALEKLREWFNTEAENQNRA